MSRNQVGHPDGEQVIKVHRNEVRLLGLMPRDVEVIGFISPSDALPRNYPDWVPEANQFLYMHVKSTISFDRPEKSPLCIEELRAFYERYISIRKGWANDLESDLSVMDQTGQLPHWRKASA